MNQVITNHIPVHNGHKNRCLSCGTTENIGRRRYCSAECRKKLHYNLGVRTGLVRALNARYATFYFSEQLIAMDMLPYGSKDTYSFSYPRSPGKKPAEDFGRMADLLGSMWWTEKRRTNKRYVASHYVLENAFRNRVTVLSVKPTMIRIPSVKETSLVDLKIDKTLLTSRDLQNIIKSAYRQQAKEHHPDIGGEAIRFRKIRQAYEDLTTWAINPTFIKRCGFPDKWFYIGNENRWIQPLPLKKSVSETPKLISW